MRPLTHTEVFELTLFAKHEGRYWKRSLRENFWGRGVQVVVSRGEALPTLYSLRNSHGPSWLHSVNLRKLNA